MNKGNQQPVAAFAEALRSVLDEKKATDITVMDVQGACPFADYLVIANGRNGRHLKSLVQDLSKVAHRFGHATRVEGMDALEWLVVDLQDVVVHLFLPEVREYFQLDRLWQAPPRDEAAAQEGACANG